MWSLSLYACDRNISAVPGNNAGNDFVKVLSVLLPHCSMVVSTLVFALCPKICLTERAVLEGGHNTKEVRSLSSTLKYVTYSLYAAPYRLLSAHRNNRFNKRIGLCLNRNRTLPNLRILRSKCKWVLFT